MKTFKISENVKEVSRVGLGCMRLTLFAYNTDLNCPEFPYEGIYSIYDFTWAE